MPHCVTIVQPTAVKYWSFDEVITGTATQVLGTNK